MREFFFNQLDISTTEIRRRIFKSTVKGAAAFTILLIAIFSFTFSYLHVYGIILCISIGMTYLILSYLGFKIARVFFFSILFFISLSASLLFRSQSYYFISLFPVIFFILMVYDLKEEIKQMIFWTVLYVSVIPIMLLFENNLPKIEMKDHETLFKIVNIINPFFVMIIEILILLKINRSTQEKLNNQLLITKKLKTEYEGLYLNLIRNLQYAEKTRSLNFIPENRWGDSLKNFFIYASDKEMNTTDFCLVEFFNNTIFYCVINISGLDLGKSLLHDLCYNGLIKSIKEEGKKTSEEIHKSIISFVKETFNEIEQENIKVNIVMTTSILDLKNNTISSYGNYPITYLICLPEITNTISPDFDHVLEILDYKIIIPPKSNFYILAGYGFHQTSNLFLAKSIHHLESFFRIMFPLPFKKQHELLMKELAELNQQFPKIDDLCVLGIKNNHSVMVQNENG